MANKTDHIEIGSGATFGFGSDCYPATVIRKTPTTVTIQDDHYEVIDGTLVYTPNFAGRIHVVRLRNSLRHHGWYSNTAGYVHFGSRRFYHDPSF